MYLPASRPHWHEAVIKQQQWTVLVLILKDNLQEMDCVMIHQMLQAKASKIVGKKNKEK